ncbi:hypothetical protein F4826_004684 [Rahnella inusitata]|nr:hypothetical protein [Rahnella inusitata]
MNALISTVAALAPVLMRFITLQPANVTVCVNKKGHAFTATRVNHD